MNKKLIFISILLLLALSLFGCKKSSVADPESITMVYRGNLGRTGYYKSKPITKKPKIKTLLETQSKDSSIFAFYTPPAIENDIAYFWGTDTNLYAFNISNSKVTWKKTIGDLPAYGVALYKGNIYHGLEYGNFFSLSSKNGKIRWKLKCAPVLVAPLVSENLVYFGTYESNAYFYALDISNGKVKWEANKKVEETTYDPYSPAISGNTLVYVLGNTLYAADKNNGRTKWKRKFLSDNWIQPVISNGLVYIGDMPGLVAIDIKTGKKIWEHAFNHEEAKRRINSPAVSENYLFIGDGIDHLIALNSKTGKEEWKSKVGGLSDIKPPSIAGKHVYVVADKITCIDFNGGKVWEMANNYTNQPVSFYNGKMYISGVDFYEAK